MNRKKTQVKEKIISSLRARIERTDVAAQMLEEGISDHELSVLLSELQIFQLELEMQNDELTTSHESLESEKSKFAGFFNLAPIGYFILDHLGIIEEANQTGISLLNITKQKLIGQRFQSFISSEELEPFYSFLYRMQNNEIKQSCKIKLLLKNEQVVDTLMEGIAVLDQTTKKLQYYIAVIDVTQSKQLSAQTQSLQNEKQKIILSAAFDAQEKERYRISTALHDSVCQILYGIRMNIQNIKTTNKLKNEFDIVNRLLDQAIRETRELSYELTPSVLRDFGFTAGIREMAQRFSTPAFKIKSTIKNSADQLHQSVQLYLFRIIQELINNCIKHANAKEAE
ncbi:MAG: PAS domain-containing protein, partial [Proteobacteria bacterium]